jgi:5-methylcytosine-specific restriction endonuclease McrA
MKKARTYRSVEHEHRTEFNNAKRRIYATETVCGICGEPVDMSLRYPNPLSKSIDHIIPLARGGHPTDLSNLQLAHLACNKSKGEKLKREPKIISSDGGRISNRNLPWSADWKKYDNKTGEFGK